MLKFLRKFLILLVVFVLGVAGTAFLMNNETTDDRSDMNNPTLPEVMVDFGGNLSNRMYGYKQKMQADYVRDCVTPLDTTKALSLVVNPYDAKVKSLSYEIRTSDGSKVLENRKIKSLKSSENYLRTDIEITSPLLMNQEYSLQILLDTDEGDIYYYTRLVSRSSTNTSQYVEFVSNFAQMCMDKNSADNLAAYLEPSESSVRNYADISIQSSLADISWGNLSPQISKKGIPVIKDINETTASVSMEYELTAIDEEGKTEYYNVTEFYRMRYTESRIRLLDFERSAEQIFNPSLSVISDNGLLLGVRDKNVSTLTDKEGTVVAFVQAGELWTYAPDTGKFVKVFGFRKDSDSDFRDSRVEHDIKLLNVSDTGDVDFMVYGYMNRGPHEGYCGVGIYRYNCDQNVIEEKVFLPNQKSYDFLKSDMGILSYVSKDNQLFLLLSQKLYQIDIQNSKYQTLVENINEDQFAVSETNGHAAWRVTKGDQKGQIVMIDFETRETRNITPEQSQKLEVIGFMNEDLIYGTVQDGDVLTDENGHSKTGISTLRIEDFDGNVKKEYHQDGLYITDVTLGDTLLEFKLCKKKGNSYKAKKKDNIMNNGSSSAGLISVEQTSSDRRGMMVRLKFKDSPGTDEPLIFQAKLRSTDERIVQLNVESTDQEVYYVYARGHLDSTWTDPAKAVKRADKQTGVVLNREQQYVWERGNVKTQYTMNTEDVPEIIRSGSWDKDKLQEGLGSAGTIIDLTGCSLENILYEVSAQRAVIAKTDADSSVVIVGFDEYNTYIMDPSTGEVKPYGMNDSTTLFQKAGNVFITYLDNNQK
mgnify:FL=1